MIQWKTLHYDLKINKKTKTKGMWKKVLPKVYNETILSDPVN